MAARGIRFLRLRGATAWVPACQPCWRAEGGKPREECMWSLMRAQRIASSQNCHPERSAAKSKDLWLLFDLVSIGSNPTGPDQYCQFYNP
jgi:hypothetical protein